MLIATSVYPNDRRLRQEAEALVAGGYEVSVICPYLKEKKQLRQEVIDGVTIYRYPAPKRNIGFVGYIWGYIYSLIAMFWTTLKVYFRKGFDVVHTNNPPDVLVLIAAFYKLLGKRYVFDHRDLAPEMFKVIFGGGRGFVYKMLVWFEKLSCQLADHIVATNESYKKIEMERSRVPEERISIVRSGPDLDVIRRVDPDPGLREKGKPIVCYAGAIGLHDGVDYMLRAIKHLVEDLGRTDFYCVLIGRGKNWQKMQAYSQELGIAEHVWFTGWVEDADFLRYLSAADICVAPDPSNPFTDRSTMIKVNEYMAMGKPVVSFNLPEHRFTAQEAGIYAEPNDELDMARKIAYLMDNPEQREKMGQAGRKRIETELSWAYQIDHLLGAYEALHLK